MKRALTMILLLSLLLSGCAASSQGMKDPVTFYYVLDEYRYGENAGFYEGEEREAAGHVQDLSYLMQLYLIGPSTEGLRSPFPKGTQILSLEQKDNVLLVALSDLSAMTDAEFNRACACLTMTCLGLTDADTVTIQSGQRSVTMSRDTLILIDEKPNTEDTQ